LLSAAAACSGAVAAPQGAPPSGDDAGAGAADDASVQPGVDAAAPDAPVGGPQYAGHGFIVHEWGTDTIVSGSDGSLQRGLHHEEEDLPAFVYDRVKAGKELSTYVKMETPVTYFYSDKPLQVTAQVRFTHGLFSQWYPEVKAMLPGIANPGAASPSPVLPADYADPFLDVHFPFVQPTCAAYYEAALQSGDALSGYDPPNGLLDWGTVDVLARGAAAGGPDAPLDQYTWSYARQVDSNAVRTAAGQSEKFLFYRGLGDFALPVKATAQAGGAVTLANTASAPVGTVFVLNVGASGGAFVEHPEGIAPGGALADVAPALAGAPGLDAFVQSLGDAVGRALTAAGLYGDEAAAMVNTWKRQWFRTPGVRVLYLAPQSWTDASIPLSIQPVPDATTRVMMIRVEVLTRELEQSDQDQAKLLASSATAAQGQAYFTALGRFAEPRLRRALGLLGSPPYGDALLGQIASAKTTVAAGE
jgi:hypothetical protein